MCIRDRSLGQYHLHRTALEVDACDELLDRRNQDPFAADLHLEEGPMSLAAKKKITEIPDIPR